MQPGAWGTQRNQPAGPFQHDFRSEGDTSTHIERINPLDGKSPVDGTGMGGADRADPLQTDNTSGQTLLAQFPKNRPFGDVVYDDAPPEVVEDF